MFTDYLTVMLINMVAGLVLLAGYVLLGLPQTDQRLWAPGFAAVGLVAIATGLHMTLTWPLRGDKPGLEWANVAFGEPTLLLGALFAAAALATALGWRLHAVAVCGAFAGAAAIVIGVAIASLKLTAMPTLAATGFILTGAAAILMPLAVWFSRFLPTRALVAALLAAAAAIWAIVGYGGLWMHLKRFSGH